MPHVENDFEAEDDLRTLVRAQEIEDDPSRVMRARKFAAQKEEEFSKLAANLPGRRPRGFNGSVRKTGMNPA